MDALKPESQILIYQSPTGNIKIDVRLENETVWLTQKLMAELFQVKPQNITMHLKNIYEEGELDEKATCKDFLQVQKEGNRTALGNQQQHTPMYMKDWIVRLDNILQLNGRELLTHAGKISHQMALEKSNLELEKYKEDQKRLSLESSLNELENDIKQIAMKSGKNQKRNSL
ncbi:MAG: RhuM family protein [Pseudomonadota bacterium]